VISKINRLLKKIS